MTTCPVDASSHDEPAHMPATIRAGDSGSLTVAELDATAAAAPSEPTRRSGLRHLAQRA